MNRATKFSSMSSNANFFLTAISMGFPVSECGCASDLAGEYRGTAKFVIFVVLPLSFV